MNKKLTIGFLTIIIVIFIVIIANEKNNTILLKRGLDLKKEISLDLKEIYGKEVEIYIIDGDVESNTRKVYFKIDGEDKKRIAIYSSSFLDSRIKYKEEVL